MSRKKNAPGLELYYKTHQEIFNKHSAILTGVLTHFGERGRNDEELVRHFLNQILPKRFSIGTGFIVSSDLKKGPSNQIDIIICDQFWNSPLYKELVAEVYPVETVYATIEVKGLLDKSPKGRKPRKADMDQALKNIAKIRNFARDKKYIKYESVPKNENEPEHLVVSPKQFRVTLPPRSYIFAFAKKGLRTLSDFKSYLEDKLTEHGDAHLHGIIVLEKNWFAFQEPYTGSDAVIHAFSDNALLRFTNTLLRGIQSVPMNVASIDDYHRAGLYKGVQAGDPTDSSYSGDPEPSIFDGEE